LVPPRLTPVAVAVGAAVGILAGIAGAVYPAYRATGVDPTEALRYE
jgi:putative ABC transport system permease protein